MASSIAFNPDVEVIPEAVLAILNCMENGKAFRAELLKKNGFEIDKSTGLSIQKVLNVLWEIQEKLGEMNLFLIGKAVTSNAILPPMKDLEEALRSIDIGYHMNSRLNNKPMFDPIRGKVIDGIGNYLLTEFDSKNKKAVMVCTNPYPSKFDEGIITQFVRKFRPANSLTSTVELDSSKPTRTNGGDSCTFLISW